MVKNSILDQSTARDFIVVITIKTLCFFEVFLIHSWLHRNRDRKFLDKLEELFINVKGYERFKDNTDIMLEPVDRK